MESVSNRIRNRALVAGRRFFACDNVSDFIEEGEREELIDEVAEKFAGVLDSLVIDRTNDPNSRDTAKRLAKMYINELHSGRYDPAPDVTAFPNVGENSYDGMLVIRAEIISMCSHHHQTVKGTCYIGIIPTKKVIGLSKYARVAQWYARRGQLQEELTVQIAKHIMKATESPNVAVYIEAEHGCMCNRGVGAFSSLTQTTVVKGEFEKLDVKNEFFQQVQMQKRG